MTRSLMFVLAGAVLFASALPLLALPLPDADDAVVRRAGPPGDDAATERTPLAAPVREIRLFRPPPRLPRDERAWTPSELRSPSYLLPFLGEPARASVP